MKHYIARHQYQCVVNALDAIQNKIAMAGYLHEARILRDASREYLDALADLLNQPDVADLWEPTKEEK